MPDQIFYKIISELIIIIVILFRLNELIKILFAVLLIELMKHVLSFSIFKFDKIFYRPNNVSLFGYPSTHVFLSSLIYARYQNIYAYIFLILTIISRYKLKYHNLFQVLGGLLFGYLFYNLVIDK